MTLRFGNTPVPKTAMWSAEQALFTAPCPHAGGHMAVCQASAQGEGRPVFGKPHMDRQRRAVSEGLCDLCAKPLRHRTMVSLSHAAPRIAAGRTLAILQVEPMLHRECAAESVRFCPSLKRDIAADRLRVRQVFRYRVQLAVLTREAVEEFTGTPQDDVCGHAKVELLKWRDRDAAWLERGIRCAEATS